MMTVELIRYPTDEDWSECKRRALITVYGKGLDVVPTPTKEWRLKMIESCHSPIRYLMFSFLIKDVPSNVSVHLCRHVHAQPYVSSLRNDRQNIMDGDEAPRNTPVNMIYDMNGEMLLTFMRKRLCKTASKETRKLAKMMRDEVIKVAPEFKDFLVPNCMWTNGCHEKFGGCGWYEKRNNVD